MIKPTPCMTSINFIHTVKLYASKKKPPNLRLNYIPIRGQCYHPGQVDN